MGNLIVSFSGNSSSKGIEELCRKLILNDIDKLLLSLKEAQSILRSTGPLQKNQKQLISLYHNSRTNYKEIEFFIEYYSPYEAKYFINGPLVPKHDYEVSGKVLSSQGFQVLEEQLFGKNSLDSLKISEQYVVLISKFQFLKEHYSTITIEYSKLCESLQLQIIRILSLTLNGYDCTINKESITETAFSLQGLSKILNCFEKSEQLNRVQVALKKCIAQLKSHPDSDSFDRLQFSVYFLNPLYRELTVYYDQQRIPVSGLNYALNLRSPELFGKSNFNKQFFSLYANDTTHQADQIALGRLLFFDPVLSSNNKRACASCHKPEKAFTDGLDKSTAFDEKGKVARNAPTLLNAAYQKLFFYDGRLFNLEEQANAVFHNSTEMNSSGSDIIRKLKHSDEYNAMFRQAFRSYNDTNLSFFKVLKCIAEFVKTFDSFESRFDKYLRGDTAKLNGEEKKGYNLFAGKALCASCHFFPLFNGVVPPMYADNEFEVLGTPATSANKSLDADPGRETVSKMQIHRGAFKTPGIRNTELTAPYMHNGVYSSLDQVLEFYNKGGGASFGFKLENQTLPFDSLGLSKTELNNIKSFLLTLTDISHIPRAPLRLPSFADSELNARKIGGEY